MSIVKHGFTEIILSAIERTFPERANQIFEKSALLQYINIKSRAASRGSKSRAGFANHYALYVLLEDYLNHKFDQSGKYSEYQGAQFSALFKRQRELPFGSKLQNHALNHRLNEEFKKYFPQSEALPVLRDAATNRYWINENLINVAIEKKTFNIARILIDIIDLYIKERQSSFSDFMTQCQEMMKISQKDNKAATSFIRSLLDPNVDARVFEIVSFSVLKAFYDDIAIFWGYEKDKLNEDRLILYKTGRTNANDGGIDFVMKPLGRFFQVTETVDAGKYFLDIDKVQIFPITFVVKSQEDPDALRAKIYQQALIRYPVKAIIERYMSCIEEIITNDELISRFEFLVRSEKIATIMQEIVLQSRVEFNVEEEGEDVLAYNESDDAIGSGS